MCESVWGVVCECVCVCVCLEVCVKSGGCKRVKCVCVWVRVVGEWVGVWVCECVGG